MQYRRGFLTLVAWVRANSFQMKQALTVRGIMGRARKSLEGLQDDEGIPTLMRCSILVKKNPAIAFEIKCFW